MRTRRGFSLLETLAATALLAMVAAACVPILRAAAAAAHPSESTVDVGSLGAVADEIAAHPETYGLAAAREVQSPPDTSGPARIEAEFTWPQAIPTPAAAGGAPQVRATLLLPSDGRETAGRWLVVSCEDIRLTRWIEAPRGDRKRRPSPRTRGARRARRAKVFGTAPGMTLVETLAALAITALLALAVVGWTVASVRTAAGAERRVRADAAAESTIRLIREDLLSGDFAAENARPGGAEREQPRARAADNQISIFGRRPASGSGRTVRRYVFDARTRTVVAMDLEPGQDAQRPRPQDPVVARGVAEFRATEERVDDRQRSPSAIVVTMRVEGGEAVTRRIRIQ